MAKLNIEYRTKEQERKNCFKNSTYFTFIIKDIFINIINPQIHLANSLINPQKDIA